MVVAAFGAAFGAANDTIISFSTKGPDSYGDGTRVLDGERYALVWVKDGAAFSGLTAACRPLDANTRVVAVASLAKGGRCPATVFEIDAGYAETFKGGSYALYLLDTRISATELAKAGEDGLPVAVNAAGAASLGGDVIRPDGGSAKAGAVALADVGVYTKVDEPKISAMRIDDENARIVLTVKGMSPVAEYMVVQGSEPGKVAAKMDTTVSGEDLIVEKPDGGTMFFRVLVTRKLR